MLLAAAAQSRVQFTRITPLLSGLLVAAGAAVAARLLGAITPLPPVFYALLVGMAIRSLVPDDRLEAGIGFASREILRFGVALLGCAITFGEISSIGWAAAAVAVGALLGTLLLGTLLCRALGDGREASIVSAAAVAICGASAALAVAAACPKGRINDQELSRIVAGITVAGTVAMLSYPLLGGLLGLTPGALGAFLGGSIHEVAQAAASGFSVSDEVGKVATVVKMLRVACLGAVVIGIGLLASRSASAEGARAPVFPGFLIAFVGLAAVSSTGIVPAAMKAGAVELSRWCLLVAIAALGLRTSFGTLLAGGVRPLLAIAANSVLLAALMLGGLTFLGTDQL